MDLEKRFAVMELKEEDHLAVKYDSPYYRGWYRLDLETEEGGKKYRDTVVRFRLPTAFVLYGDVIRNFTPEERLVGVHRFLKGKDLQAEVEALLKKGIDEYVKTLSAPEVKELLGKMKDLVTLDCNRIPYLRIRKDASDVSDSDQEIRKFVASHPDYLRMLYDVLNGNITISEVTNYSNHVIYNEMEDMVKKPASYTPEKRNGKIKFAN